MCQCGCINENCWGECTVTMEYCEMQELDLLDKTKKTKEGEENGNRKSINN